MADISVIIPTFNRATQIRTAVESALFQSLTPREIIVIDDGSTDGTEEALAPLRDQIRYIKTENSGVSAARNRGIREAQGGWIAFLDSDDTWLPSKLERQWSAIGQAASKVCFCVSADESGEPIDDIQRMDPLLQPGDSRSYNPGNNRFFMHPGHPFLQSMLVEREALMETGLFDESLKVAEDTKLLYELITRFGYSVVNETLVRICRKREVPGLSDSMDAAAAFTRHDCYIRVQSEFFWRLSKTDPGTAELLRGNLLYFASRQAELACALRNRNVAKGYARVGLNPYSCWKSLCRSILILLFYPIAERIFIRKWSPSASAERIPQCLPPS